MVEWHDNNVSVGPTGHQWTPPVNITYFFFSSTLSSSSGRPRELGDTGLRSSEHRASAAWEPVPLGGALLTDKRRIHLRSASVRSYTFFTIRIP
jgi:hypothetical protein